MSQFIVTKSGPTTEALREWGADHGFPRKDEKRGRPSKALIEAYNKTHRGALRYDPKTNPAVSSVTVEAKPAKGRKVSARVNTPAARAELKAAGIAVGKRGRLPQAALAGLVLQAKAKG